MKMTTFNRNLKHFLGLTLIFLLGCGTWVGTPEDDDDDGTVEGNSDVTIAFEGDNGTALTQESLAIYGVGGEPIGTLSLTTARLVLREIRLKRQGTGEQEDTEKFEGPYLVDLISDTVSPNPGTISLPDGSYDSIELRLHKLKEDDIGNLSEQDPIVDNSIHLTGSYTPEGGAARMFSMTFDFGEDFKIPTSSGSAVEIVENVQNNINVAFDLTTWFDFSDADEDFSNLADGPIVLDDKSEDEADDIRKSIKDNIKRSASFAKKGDTESASD